MESADSADVTTCLFIAGKVKLLLSDLLCSSRTVWAADT